MASLLERIQSTNPFALQRRGQQSLDWFREQLRGIKVSYNQIQRETNYVTRVELGKMYMYLYDAKHKNILPYWDYFPCVIPFQYTKDGFYGINLHYIRPADRLLLLDALYELIVNEDTEEELKIKVVYEQFKYITRLKYAKPCIKRYLTSHINSRILEVSEDKWDMMAMLPSQQFNINANTVYAESRTKY
jgi:hypothetical protein